MWIEDKVRGLEDKVRGLEDKVCGLKDKVRGLEDKVCEYEDKVCGLEDKVCGLEDKVCGLEDKVGAYKFGDPSCVYIKFKLTITLLTWRIWWAPDNARRWQMGFNSAFKGLNPLGT